MCKTPFDFVRLRSTLAANSGAANAGGANAGVANAVGANAGGANAVAGPANAGAGPANAAAGPSNRHRKTASSPSPIPIVEHTAAALLPICEVAFHGSLQPTPPFPSGSQAGPAPLPPHIEVIFLFLFFSKPSSTFVC
jgi:hypothetical protein